MHEQIRRGDVQVLALKNAPACREDQAKGVVLVRWLFLIQAEISERHLAPGEIGQVIQDVQHLQHR